MKKKILVTILIVFLLILGFGGKYIVDRSQIFTGYAAKNLASGIFIAGRSQESLEEEDLNFSLVSLAKNRVDYENKIVYSDFYGFGNQKAVYREGLGVCLVYEGTYPDAENQSQKIEEAPASFQTEYWPKGQKIRDNLSVVFDVNKLSKAIDASFEKGNTRAVLVLYDTLVLAEKYADGFDKDTRIQGWSMSKSVVNALYGIMVRKYGFNIDKPAPVHEWEGDERHNITTRNLLNMTSGLSWVEDYGDISTATVMLYESPNLAEMALRQPIAYPPDSVWYYSSGTSNILTEILKRQINNNAEYWELPYKELFHKISMFSAIMETDASGNFVGSSYTYATPRDWARFGLLYLEQGVWFGDTILSPDWVKFTYTPAPNSDGEYGVQFWLNASGKELPDAPRDIYYADGYQGQRVYVIPSKNLVIVRMGLTKKKDFDYNKMITDILDALMTD